jgi:hypothetical protein
MTCSYQSQLHDSWSFWMMFSYRFYIITLPIVSYHSHSTIYKYVELHLYRSQVSQPSRMNIQIFLSLAALTTGIFIWILIEYWEQWLSDNGSFICIYECMKPKNDCECYINLFHVEDFKILHDSRGFIFISFFFDEKRRGGIDGFCLDLCMHDYLFSF